MEEYVARESISLKQAQDSLSVSSLDGKNRMVLINKGMNEPHDIAVEPESG